jgi:hypothetical protein
MTVKFAPRVPVEIFDGHIERFPPSQSFSWHSRPGRARGHLARPDSSPTIAQITRGLIVFVALPANFVLLLGWVVAGFRN